MVNLEIKNIILVSALAKLNLHKQNQKQIFLYLFFLFYRIFSRMFNNNRDATIDEFIANVAAEVAAVVKVYDRLLLDLSTVYLLIILN